MGYLCGKDRNMRNFASVLTAVACVGLNCAGDSVGIDREPAFSLNGKAGHELMEAVGKGFAPKVYRTDYGGENGIWETLKHTDSREDGSGFVNRFSDEPIYFGENGGAPSNMELLPVASQRWWRPTSDNYDPVAKDLLNMFVAPAGVWSAKGDAVAGEVDALPADGRKWAVGMGSVGGVRLTLWEPPEELKGDVARAMMYVAAVYGSGIKRFETGYGMVWAEDVAEGFTSAYASQLMVWHRTDPPSAYEMERNVWLGGMQGNVNPFVAIPSLAEYLWGERKGEVFDATQVAPEPEPETDNRPLRAEYSLTDGRINLWSDFVPEDAHWSVDGRAVDGKWVVPAVIGAGVHELKFEAPGCRGAVKVLVREQ